MAFDLNSFMDKGILEIMGTAGRYYGKSVRGRGFLAKAAPSMAKAMHTRKRLEKQGVHVPSFLIASIASECNLFCTGCYARANGTIGAEAKAHELSEDQWARIFDEADEIGVSFVLIAGGEPLLRRGVIEHAASHAGMVFPIFTNGTYFDQGYLDLFDEHRNLVPVFSLEGDARDTDERRGMGVAQRVADNIDEVNRRGILWGASLTVTEANLDTVTSDAFVHGLHEAGCGLVIYNEYVPIQCGTEDLALGREQQQMMMDRLDKLRAEDANAGMSMIAFPGNEERMGGCLAAGRGFFHISQSGDAEPCPFSPYSVANVAEVGLLGALESPFFKRIREVEAAHADEHKGGCTLFLHEDEVRAAQRECAEGPVVA